LIKHGSQLPVGEL